MRVILRTDLANIGKKGDVLDVADGFARNYLVPKSLAMQASKATLVQATAMRKARDIRYARDRESSEQVARALVAKVIRIPAKAGSGGRLFGSVTSSEVAGAVETQAGLVLDRRKIHLEEPIKTLGPHEILVKLHPEVEFRVTVEVVTS